MRPYLTTIIFLLDTKEPAVSLSVSISIDYYFTPLGFLFFGLFFYKYFIPLGFNLNYESVDCAD
ncbi:Hypothetical protein IALB_2608 [Ignavibacterium album JCM 16511]|uniref:Uncharacterized protein n=1 Tax=Ignavibacterium album (strain DSM 19864 / JCM 16511 / NBRC 101810 / Mat9-16) TaxID=945713 RepID=I0AMV4_IGNAJ|nr:hypothetical protein [Ignavibacterium album]AFH50311.1 Hypothetical protein IALB_2608 [Ignavibacterium album JCM 16511]